MPENSQLFETLTSTQNIMAGLQSAATYCMELLHGFKNENFTLEEARYTHDGMLVKYLCKIDGRTYRVNITSEK